MNMTVHFGLVRDRRSPLTKFLVLSPAFIAFVFVSCSSPAEPERPPATHSLTFITGFPVKARHAGVHTNQPDGREFVYFADAVTHKKLLFFDTKGNLVDSVGLTAGIDSLGEIAGLSILSMDTIVLSSMYTNKVALIGRRGNVIGVTDLSPMLARPDSAYYETWASATTPFLAGNACYFSIALVANSIRQEQRAPLLNDAQQTARYYHLNNLSPRIVSVTGIGDEPQVTFALDSFYWKMHSGPFAMPESGLYECLNDLVFVRSNYSSVIQVLSAHDHAAHTSFSVASRHSAAAISPHATGPSAILHLQDSVNQRLATGGYVQAIRYDVPSGHYLVVLVHSIPATSPAEERGLVRPFSILEYDSTFQLVREHEFEGRRHLMFSLLCLSTGTYIQRWEDQRVLMSGKHAFDLLPLDAGE